MTDQAVYKKLILDKFDELSKKQKKISQFFIDYPEEFAFSSIESIAEKLNVGKSTIVRLAQTLGYKGFLELKNELSSSLMNNLGYTKKLKDSLKTVKTTNDFISTFTTNEIKNIQETIQKIEKDSFNKAIQIFISANNIYTLGSGISSFLSEIAAYYFNRMNMKTRAFTHGSVNFEEQVVSLKKKDAILVFSLPPYEFSFTKAIEAAKYKGIKIITITDKLTSPVSKFSDVVFLCETDNIVFINTITSVLTLVYIITTGIGLSDRTTALISLSLLEKVESEFGFDIHTDFFK